MLRLISSSYNRANPSIHRSMNACVRAIGRQQRIALLGPNKALDLRNVSQAVRNPDFFHAI
jgi:hypothetical protein